MSSFIYVGRTNEKPPRIKAVMDKDCLPDNLVHYSEFISAGDNDDLDHIRERFWHYHDKMKWLENLGFVICIDFGYLSYETGERVTSETRR